MSPVLRFGLVIILFILNGCKDDDPTWPKSANTDVLDFGFASQPGLKATIDVASGAIRMTMGYTDLTKLVPTIKLPAKATLTPAANVPQDFSKPVIYTVTAQNGVAKKYTVSIEQEYNETLLAGNSDGYLYAYSVQTGKLKWKFGTGGAIKSDVAVAGNLVFFGSEDNKFYAVDMTSGKATWTIDTDGAPRNSCPLISNGMVYFTDQEELYAVRIATGKQEWKTSGGNKFRTSPVLANGWICVGGANGLAAYEVIKGEQKWAYNTISNVISNPAVSGGLIYFGISGADSSGFFAIDAVEGKEKWRTKAAANVNNIKSSPTVANGNVYVGTENRALVAINAGDGILNWSLLFKEPVSSSPVVADSLLILNMASGVSSYRITTNSKTLPGLKWRYPNGAAALSGLQQVSSPVYANGIVYITGNAGFVGAVDVVSGNSPVQFEAHSKGLFSSPCIVTRQGEVFQSGVSGAVN